MANFVQIKDANGVVVNVEAVALNDGLGDTVFRQGIYIGGETAFGPVVNPNNTDPAQTDNALPVRPVRDNILVYHTVGQASTNAVNIKNAAGQIFGWNIFNNATGIYPVFIKLFNQATTPIPGTDAPFMTIGVQAGVSREVWIDRGFDCSLGLGICIVKGIGDFDLTPISAGDCVVDIFYL